MSTSLRAGIAVIMTPSDRREELHWSLFATIFVVYWTLSTEVIEGPRGCPFGEAHCEGPEIENPKADDFLIIGGYAAAYLRKV